LFILRFTSNNTADLSGIEALKSGKLTQSVIHIVISCYPLSKKKALTPSGKNLFPFPCSRGQ